MHNNPLQQGRSPSREGKEALWILGILAIPCAQCRGTLSTVGDSSPLAREDFAPEALAMSLQATRKDRGVPRRPSSQAVTHCRATHSWASPPACRPLLTADNPQCHAPLLLRLPPTEPEPRSPASPLRGAQALWALGETPVGAACWARCRCCP